MNPRSSVHFCLQIPSRPENIAWVEPFVEQIKQFRPFSEAKYFDILLVLTEAVNNCILHGNCANPTKFVTLQLNIHATQVCIVITDEGHGFNSDTLPDPTSAARVTEPNGRGVFLMQQLADEMHFADNGRTVSIVFNA